MIPCHIWKKIERFPEKERSNKKRRERKTKTCYKKIFLQEFTCVFFFYSYSKHMQREV